MLFPPPPRTGKGGRWIRNILLLSKQGTSICDFQEGDEQERGAQKGGRNVCVCLGERNTMTILDIYSMTVDTLSLIYLNQAALRFGIGMVSCPGLFFPAGIQPNFSHIIQSTILPGDITQDRIQEMQTLLRTKSGRCKHYSGENLGDANITQDKIQDMQTFLRTAWQVQTLLRTKIR